MKRTLAISMALLALGCMARPAAKSGALVERENVGEEVGRIERYWADAYMRRDTFALRELLADEFTDIDDRRTASKSEYLAEMSRLAASSDRFVLTDGVVRGYGDALVSTGHLRLGGEMAGAGAHYMAVYVRRRGRWQPVAFQLTPIHAP